MNRIIRAHIFIFLLAFTLLGKVGAFYQRERPRFSHAGGVFSSTEDGITLWSHRETLCSTDSESFTVTDEQYLRFGGVGRLYASADEVEARSVIARLLNAHVLVIGIGGVGSWAAEALARSAIGHLTLVDLDDICISNTNRQAHALSTTIGNMKIDEMGKRLKLINPECQVDLVHDFIGVDNVKEVISSAGKVDVLLDAMDGSREKSALLAACANLGIPVVTCGGAAGKSDATQIVCRDLIDVEGDKLLATCRKDLRKWYGFPAGVPFHDKRNKRVKEKPWNIHAVYSLEDQKQLPVGEDASSLRRCDGALGTAVFVTGSVGFAAAGQVIDMIARSQLVPPSR